MPEKDDAYKNILNREKVEKDVKKFFQSQIYLLKSLVDYGTNLMPRCFSSSKREIEDIVILSVLLKHVVSMLDSIEILFAKGAIFTAQLQARALFESSLYIEWIFEKNTKSRSKQYYVWILRQEMDLAKKVTTGFSESDKFLEILEKFDEFIIEELKINNELYKKELETYNNFLLSEDYKEINLAFEKQKEKSIKKQEAPWYKLSGPSSICDMAERLNRRAEYEIFYRHYSNVMHGTSFQEHISISKGKLYLDHIRSLKNSDVLLITTISTILKLYWMIIEYYRPNELEHFRKKFVSEWGEKIKSIKEVKEIYKDVDL